MNLQIVAILVFLGIASLVFFILYLVVPRKSLLEERLEGLGEEKVIRPEPSLLQEKLTAWEKFLEKLGRKLPMRPADYGAYTKMLVAAGVRKERLPIFIGLKVFFAVALPAFYLVSYGIPAGKNAPLAALIAIAFAIIGFIAPGFWLSRKVKNRQLEIFHDLPDILDLMTVSVEAGLSMDSAILRISESKQFEKSPLIREMKIMLQETRAGKLRHEALRDMGERSMEEDLKSFAAMLIQTERLGTSLADSLRIHSDSLRTKRRQMAEEAAAKTTIKLLFPLAFLLFPTMFVVVLLPALIRMGRVLSGIGEGGE